jgi:hypothetical protein
VKNIIKEGDVRFSPGYRLVNLNDIVQEFKHLERQPESHEIYAILDGLVSELKLGRRGNEQGGFGIK